MCSSSSSQTTSSRFHRPTRESRGNRSSANFDDRPRYSYCPDTGFRSPRDSYRPDYSGIQKDQPWKKSRAFTYRRISEYFEERHFKEDDLEEGELGNEFCDARRNCRSSSPLSSSISRGSTQSSRFDDILAHPVDKYDLSDRIFHERVRADYNKRASHSGMNAVKQFDLRQPYVEDIIDYMHRKYDTVCVYSLSMLKSGDIIYFLQPFTLGLSQDDHSAYSAKVGDLGCTARMKLKGRFAIVVNVYKQCIKVATMTTFNHEGLESKPRRVHSEYCGIRETGDARYTHPSLKNILIVESSCCRIEPTTSVHLVTDKISLSNQIMIAGKIKSNSVDSLKRMIDEVEYGHD